MTSVMVFWCLEGVKIILLRFLPDENDDSKTPHPPCTDSVVHVYKDIRQSFRQYPPCLTNYAMLMATLMDGGVCLI